MDSMQNHQGFYISHTVSATSVAPIGRGATATITCFLCQDASLTSVVSRHSGEGRDRALKVIGINRIDVR